MLFVIREGLGTAGPGFEDGIETDRIRFQRRSAHGFPLRLALIGPTNDGFQDGIAAFHGENVQGLVGFVEIVIVVVVVVGATTITTSSGGRLGGGGHWSGSDG